MKATKRKVLGETQEKNGKAIEDIYQKKTQLEHILLRPDTYIGSVEEINEYMWVFDVTEKRMVYKRISFVPGLFKIFDEIIVNAADNKQRDNTMASIRVDIDPIKNFISVWNDGRGIPVEMHKEHKVYVPELIFGHLLTGSNYDDDEKKTTGGRNGYGAKLANIFSTKFIVETADSSRGKLYKQVFRNNMTEKEAPVITSGDEDWTRVKFFPDLHRFGVEKMDDEIVSLFTKRVYDLAGATGGTTKVYLNGKKLPVRNFSQYVDMYLEDTSLPRIHEKVSGEWEVVATVSDGTFQQVSFVNSICTTKGGTHVNHVADQITSAILSSMKKKSKKTILKQSHLKNYLCIFVNSLIVNPAFDSQTKETLTTRHQSFGSKCELSEAFLKNVSRSGIVDRVMSWVRFKENSELKKSDGQKKSQIAGIPKLDDANEAGGRHSLKCTLILTEGDSAKTLAVSGMSIVGRDYYGIFPLRGKLLNVREANAKQIKDNAEISALKQILGLKQAKAYDNEKDLRTLRYGRVMIMTDQDHDGSHIKGLLMNFFHTYWPALLSAPGFLVEFATPIVKARKGATTEVFFTLPEYFQWKRTIPNEKLKKWFIKYYKGLGTSTAEEAREYFSNLKKHVIEFKSTGDENNVMELAFGKKNADRRKGWILDYDPEAYVDHSKAKLSYYDFVHKELVLFSVADNMRSIPCIMDGLKPGQRKILFSCFKRKLVKELKVAQLAGYVSEHSAYHHGEQSLAGAIVGMAQNFVGANNINLLYPSGQFGTRIQGGTDSASPRYIYTKLCNIARKLYHDDDDALLEFLFEDGQSIEPKWYIPVIPMCLVNGCKGIGTGWSCDVPSYDPRDIIENIRNLLSDKPWKDMKPWSRGFTGEIQEGKDETSYNVFGTIRKLNDTTLEISELPIGTWTQKYKEHLESMMPGQAKAFISSYKDYNTDITVRFVVELSEEKMKEAEDIGLHKKFKLMSTISTTNMTLFDQSGRINKYTSVYDIFGCFYEERLRHYGKRKRLLVEKISQEYEKLDNKAKFIRAVIKGDIVVGNKAKAMLVEEMERYGLKKFFAVKDVNGDEEEEANQQTTKKSDTGYEYLLSMPIWSLTLERANELHKEREKKETQLQELVETDHKQLWLNDLTALEQELNAFENQFQKKFQGEDVRRGGSRVVKKSKGKQLAKKKAKASDYSDDDDEEDYDDVSDEDYESDGYVKPPVVKNTTKAFTYDSSTLVKPPAPVKKSTVRVPKERKAPKQKGRADSDTSSLSSATRTKQVGKTSVMVNDENESGLSLFERLKKRTSSQPMKKLGRKLNPLEHSDELEIQTSPKKRKNSKISEKKASPKKRKLVTKKKSTDIVATKKGKKKSTASVFSDFSASEEETVVKPKKKTTGKGQKVTTVKNGKKNVKKVPKASSIDSDVSEDEYVPSPIVPSPQRVRRAAKRVTYKDMLDSEDESSFEIEKDESENSFQLDEDESDGSFYPSD